MGYQLIETIEVGAGGAASIQFTEIPQDGVDLLLLASLRGTSSTSVDEFRFNFAGTSYNATSQVYLGGNGSAASSFTSEGNGSSGAGIWLDQNAGNSTSNTFSNTSILCANYTSSTTKSFSTDSVTEENGTTAYQRILASIRPMSAVTSLTISTYNSPAIAQYSTASLYKITAD
jgi:hypothetical protein